MAWNNFFFKTNLNLPCLPLTCYQFAFPTLWMLSHRAHRLASSCMHSRATRLVSALFGKSHRVSHLVSYIATKPEGTIRYIVSGITKQQFRRKPIVSKLFSSSLNTHLISTFCVRRMSHTSHNGSATSDKGLKPPRVSLTDEEWQQRLTPKEYLVLRKQYTEAPWSYKQMENAMKEVEERGEGKSGHSQDTQGTFVCRACRNPLYYHRHNFDSGCG